MMKETATDNAHVIVDPKREKKSELKLKQIAIKQFLLSLTAMISTIVAYPNIIIFELPQVWGSIDVIISTFCVMLMYRWYDDLAWKIFKTVCCCCCCKKWMQFHQDMIELEGSVKAGADVEKKSSVNTNTDDQTETTQTTNSVNVVIR